MVLLARLSSPLARCSWNHQVPTLRGQFPSSQGSFWPQGMTQGRSSE